MSPRRAALSLLARAARSSSRLEPFAWGYVSPLDAQTRRCGVAADAAIINHRSNWAMYPSICRAQMSTLTLDDKDVKARIDELNDKFVEARDEIELAQDDAETVYFNDSVIQAREVVAEVLAMWEAVLGDLTPDEGAKLQRSMGLKMEQLKAELKALDHLHDDH